MHKTITFGILAPAMLLTVSEAADPAPLVQARVAVERVYYGHRTGTKSPFEKAVPVKAVETKMELVLKKEFLLRRVYGVAVTKAMVDQEVARIGMKTKAPEMLAEIKEALGGDEELYAEVFAKPLVVERELRQRFDNDDTRHAGKRRKVDEVRGLLFKADAGERGKIFDAEGGKIGTVSETTWKLGPQPKEKDGPEALRLEDLPPEVGPLGPGARVLTPGEEKDPKRYLEEVQEDLRKVIEAQLKNEGDVSAVIEAPQGFLLYLVTEKTDEVLAVKALTVRKADYSEWVKDSKILEKQ